MSEDYRDQVKVNNANGMIVLFTRISRLTTARALRATHTHGSGNKGLMSTRVYRILVRNRVCAGPTRSTINPCSFINPQLRASKYRLHDSKPTEARTGQHQWLVGACVFVAEVSRQRHLSASYIFLVFNQSTLSLLHAVSCRHLSKRKNSPRVRRCHCLELRYL